MWVRGAEGGGAQQEVWLIAVSDVVSLRDRCLAVKYTYCTVQRQAAELKCVAGVIVETLLPLGWRLSSRQTGMFDGRFCVTCDVNMYNCATHPLNIDEAIDTMFLS